jgi:hypothetical protein
MTHQELILRLASNFDLANNLVFTECRLGSTWLNGGVPIPDLVVIAKSYTRPNIRIYEVKATQNDFAGDLRSHKWEKYRGYAERIYFALGPDIEPPDWFNKDFPCGLVRIGEKGVRTLRPAPPSKDWKPWTMEVMLSLLIQGRCMNFNNELSALHEVIEAETKLREVKVRDGLNRYLKEVTDREHAVATREERCAALETAAFHAVADYVKNKLGFHAYCGGKDSRDVVVALIEGYSRYLLHQITRDFSRRLQEKTQPVAVEQQIEVR